MMPCHVTNLPPPKMFDFGIELIVMSIHGNILYVCCFTSTPILKRKYMLADSGVSFIYLFKVFFKVYK